MSSFLKRALEEQADQGKQVVLMGPLSDVFTKALNVVYSKEDPVTGEAKPMETPLTNAMESQAMDVAAVNKLAALLAPATPEANDAINVYGVSADEITDDDIVNVTTALADTPADRRDDFIVVLDGMGNGPNGLADGVEERYEKLGAALEQLCESHGVKVFHSLNAFAHARFG